MEVQKASSMATSATKKARSHATKGSSSKPPRRKSSGPKPFPTIDEDEDEIPLERAARIQSMRKKHSFHDTSLPSVSPNPQRNEGGAAAKTVIPSRKQKRSAIKDKAVNETSNNEELEVDGQAWTPLERQVEILKVYSYYQFISKSIGSTIEKWQPRDPAAHPGRVQVPASNKLQACLIIWRTLAFLATMRVYVYSRSANIELYFTLLV